MRIDGHCRPAALPGLVQYVIHQRGAVMNCHYCADEQAVEGGDIVRQIVVFQDRHFACDPAVSSASRPSSSDLPRQRTGTS